MKKFQNLKNDECLGIHKKIYVNSRTLFKTGSQAAEQENYGVACSLIILGGEELLKALIIFCKGMGIEVFKIREVNKLLTQHEKKHELIEIAYLAETIFSVVKDKFEELLRSPKINWYQRFKFSLKRMNFLLHTSNEYKRRLEKIEQASIWWKNANNLKNRGLYVDYVNEILSPENITIDQYIETKMMYRQLWKRYMTITTYLEVSNRRDEWNIVKDINKSIEMYLEGKFAP